jgi:chromosome segregation ATPase
MFILSIQKALIWLKNHWIVPLAAIGILLYGLFSYESQQKLANLLKQTNDRHNKEIEDLIKAHEEELAQRDAALKKYQDSMQSIQDQYEKAKKDLDVEKQKEAEAILSDTKSDPTELAKRLSDATGISIYVPPTS